MARSAVLSGRTSSFPGEHPIFMSLVWTVGLLVVLAPLAVRKYRSIDR